MVVAQSLLKEATKIIRSDFPDETCLQTVPGNRDGDIGRRAARIPDIAAGFGTGQKVDHHLAYAKDVHLILAFYLAFKKNAWPRPSLATRTRSHYWAAGYSVQSKR